MKLKYVKKACQITDNIFKKLINNFNFKTEKELADFILKEIKKRKLKHSFPPIVASHKNYQNIHHKPKKDYLSRFVIIDFGVKYKGYCSDMTRTIYIGQPKKYEIQLYDLVLKTHQKTIKKIKPDIKASEIDAYARNQLKPYQKYFKHALGHGLGRKIHQKPKISPNSPDRLKKGDIFAIEPGLYKRGCFGIRIENTIYLGKKTQILTKSPQKFYIFPKPL